VDAFSFVDDIAVTTELIIKTLRQSGAVLTVFLFFALIAVILISGIIYTLEQGKFIVSADYPKGEFMRPNIDGIGTSVSPFKSALVGIYWTIITCECGRAQVLLLFVHFLACLH
jgi:hypothetical protein